MVANLPTRTIRQYCHTLSIFFSIAWYIVVSNLHRLELNYYCPYMYRILLMWKQQPQMHHLLNPVSLCVEVMTRSKMPSWSLNLHPYSPKCQSRTFSEYYLHHFFVFNVHYPEGCCNFYSLLKVLFLNKKIPPRKPQLSALVTQLRDSLHSEHVYVIRVISYLYFIPIPLAIYLSCFHLPLLNALYLFISFRTHLWWNSKLHGKHWRVRFTTFDSAIHY